MDRTLRRCYNFVLTNGLHKFEQNTDPLKNVSEKLPYNSRQKRKIVNLVLTASAREAKCTRESSLDNSKNTLKCDVTAISDTAATGGVHKYPDSNYLGGQQEYSGDIKGRNSKNGCHGDPHQKESDEQLLTKEKMIESHPGAILPVVTSLPPVEQSGGKDCTERTSTETVVDSSHQQGYQQSNLVNQVTEPLHPNDDKASVKGKYIDESHSLVCETIPRDVETIESGAKAILEGDKTDPGCGSHAAEKINASKSIYDDQVKELGQTQQYRTVNVGTYKDDEQNERGATLAHSVEKPIKEDIVPEGEVNQVPIERKKDDRTQLVNGHVVESGTPQKSVHKSTDEVYSINTENTELTPKDKGFNRPNENLTFSKVDGLYSGNRSETNNSHPNQNLESEGFASSVPTQSEYAENAGAVPQDHDATFAENADCNVESKTYSLKFLVSIRIYLNWEQDEPLDFGVIRCATDSEINTKAKKGGSQARIWQKPRAAFKPEKNDRHTKGTKDDASEWRNGVEGQKMDSGYENKSKGKNSADPGWRGARYSLYNGDDDRNNGHAPKYPFFDKKSLTRIEIVKRNTNSLLNKLTIDNFARITEKLCTEADRLTCEEELILMVDLLFTKALTETDYSEMYSDLCLMLKWRTCEFNPTSGDNKPITFMRSFLNKCQDQFERLHRGHLDLSTDDEGDKADTALKKKKILGNIRFIGELYKRGLLPTKVVSEVVDKLTAVNVGDSDHPKIKYPREHFIESLTELLKTIGFTLDVSEKNRRVMDKYIKILEGFQANGNYALRIQYRIQDLLELRKNNWRQKIFREKAKSIAEIHRDAMREEEMGGSIHVVQEGTFDIVGQRSLQPYVKYLDEQRVVFEEKKRKMKENKEKQVLMADSKPNNKMDSDPRNTAQGDVSPSLNRTKETNEQDQTIPNKKDPVKCDLVKSTFLDQKDAADVAQAQAQAQAQADSTISKDGDQDQAKPFAIEALINYYLANELSDKEAKVNFEARIVVLKEFDFPKICSRIASDSNIKSCLKLSNLAKVYIDQVKIHTDFMEKSWNLLNSKYIPNLEDISLDNPTACEAFSNVIIKMWSLADSVEKRLLNISITDSMALHLFKFFNLNRSHINDEFSAHLNTIDDFAKLLTPK